MSTNELTSKAQELKELKNMMDELKAEISALEGEIKDEMITRDIDELTLGPFKIKWTPFISSRFDSKAFKATHNELYKQYIKKTSTKRFSIA